MKKIRVLIVDDSATMRKLIRTAISADPRIDVVAEASDAREARDAVNLHAPDVMTLDIEMPNMSGLEFLERLMRHRPMPVVMISTLTRQGSAAAVEALALGAVECIEKPRYGNAQDTFEKLIEAICVAANARVKDAAVTPHVARVQSGQTYQKICLIGGSTGAVDAIERILSRFPADCPPTMITQHMPAPFLASFAARLDPIVKPHVTLAENGRPLRAGEVVLAPGGDFHLELGPEGTPVTRLLQSPPVSGHRPSVDVMFRSALSHAPRVVAAILTGMGRDGADGLTALRDAGAVTLGQSKDSCVVFGMPRVAGEMGGVSEWVDLEDMGDRILALAATAPRSAAHGG
ncbi:Chemotaxis response regulator protein-glutamate methylesterase [Aquimixticola soesokkakensis]|uniref:Protein-glutamate methylesterase/protein-glutamine glutaminase n=1 Tax=Aquimixticola soesokkakensis TaxID=1519096 RepID=A0A1Y5T814_9RHOB|nr:Chemotaxis response regulator protein-glutamate methylesterase [Aquimixticola soesokkakensis]